MRKCSQWENLRFLYRIGTGGRPFDMAHVNTQRVREVRIRCLTRAERQQRMSRGGCFSTAELGSALQDLLHASRNPSAQRSGSDMQRVFDQSVETAVEAEPDAEPDAVPMAREAIASSTPSSEPTQLPLPRPPPPTPQRSNTMIASSNSSSSSNHNKRRKETGTNSMSNADDVPHGVWNCDGEVLRATELSIVLHPQLIRFFGRGIEPLTSRSSGDVQERRAQASLVEQRDQLRNAHRDVSSASLPADVVDGPLELHEVPSPTRNGRSNTRSVARNLSVLGNGSSSPKKKRNLLQRLLLNLQPKNKRVKQQLAQSATSPSLFLE